MSKFLSQLSGLRTSGPSSVKNRGNRFRMTTSYRRVLLILALILVVMLYFKWVQPTQVAILKRLAGKPVQMFELENLLTLASTPLSADARYVLPLSEADLPQIRDYLRNQGIKPSLLRIITVPDTTLELQAKDVSFEIVVVVMKELQRRWQITPFLAEIVSGQSAGMVDMLITFKQEK